ncbi:MAG: M48 family metalloprotease [Planctomycetaceae bacterium]|nr:M48 family metalloprotease [Planctomycetaceae bacterium]
MTPEESIQRLIEAIRAAKIEPVRRTFLYRLGVGLVAGVVILLPLVYVGSIGLLGYGIWWHALNNTELLDLTSHRPGRGSLVAVLLYVAPFVVGPLAILFMLKPLFARTVEQGHRLSLRPQVQPQLFEFVNAIADAVHAPRPSRIDIDGSINASASYGNGVLSLFRTEFVLTLGVPLVAGVNLQQLAGILAHEFGHFGQGAGMRLSGLVRSINLWFFRVVYERDVWDAYLIVLSEELDLRIGWVLWLTRLFVFLSRQVLWCLMMVSALLSGWFSRQLEFDADLHEIRLAGSENFEATCKRLLTLNFALMDFLHDPPPEDQVGNPIRSFVIRCDDIERDIQKHVKKYIRKSKTGWFDTHPADKERIDHAREHDCPGVFRSQLPAEHVFRKFDGLCVRVMEN